MTYHAGMLRQLLQFDQSVHTLLPGVVLGIDEVGRGCLAGPVVAAAVCLPEITPRSKLSRALKQLNDSKKVTPIMRENLAAIIQECGIYAIAEASVEEINDFNILRASLLAMKRARRALIKLVPHAVLLVDGNQSIPGLSDPQIPVVGGDGRSAVIAAASIIAKVYRDALMTKLSASYEPYCFAKNKGYGSAEHLNAIRLHGPTPYHRTVFIRELVEVRHEVLSVALT
jgi:ribonuclease HII